MKDITLRLAFFALFLMIIPFIVTLCIKEKPKEEYYNIRIFESESKKMYDVDIEDYLINVVLSEMPPSFHIDALKAQAISARTYALRKINKNDIVHNGADLCDNPDHCQAMLSIDKLKEKYKDDFSKYYDKVKKAVQETKGEVLKFNGELAVSVFHSCSDGYTENAKDVWGGDYEYLVSVSSEGDYDNKNYISYLEINKDEFIKKIEAHIGSKVDLNKTLISDISKTNGGNVATLKICGETLKGTDIRNIFKLKSSSFKISVDNNQMIFEVYGYGHGVGMSQYGANFMAKNNFKYKDILYHYYPGTKIFNLYKK